jgi:hypothetical protein
MRFALILKSSIEDDGVLSFKLSDLEFLEGLGDVESEVVDPVYWWFC